MEIQEIKTQLSSKVVLPYYIFTGAELGIMDVYLDLISKTADMPIKRPDTLGLVYSKLMSNTLMERPSCYVIRDDKDFLQQEKLWDRLLKNEVQGKNVMIFIYSDIDKRSKFYKHHSDRIVSFDHLAPEVLAKYIKKDIGLGIKEAVEFASLCDCDYGRIKLEQDKLEHLAAVEKISITEAYTQAVNTGLIYSAPRDLIFELIDSVCTRKAQRSYDIWSELKEKGENPLAILSLLYNNFRSILLVQTGGSAPDLSERTGLSAWQIKMAKEKSGKYTVGELIENLKIIRWTEKGIKVGMIEQEMAIDYTLGEVLF